MFEGRQWPEGYNFPACESCNAATRDEEKIFALITRVGPEADTTPAGQKEILKLMRSVIASHPEFLKPFDTSEKLEFFKSEGVGVPHGVLFSDVPLVGMESKLTETVLGKVLTKLFCALHYMHTKNIVPVSGRIFVRWMTNAYAHKANVLDDFKNALGGRVRLVRSSHGLDDQFNYAYGISDDREFSAYYCTFRDSFIAWGMILKDSDLEDLSFPEFQVYQPFAPRG